MNNPFTSDRAIFNNLSRKKVGDVAKQSKTQPPYPNRHDKLPSQDMNFRFEFRQFPQQHSHETDRQPTQQHQQIRQWKQPQQQHSSNRTHGQSRHQNENRQLYNDQPNHRYQRAEQKLTFGRPQTSDDPSGLPFTQYGHGLPQRPAGMLPTGHANHNPNNPSHSSLRSFNEQYMSRQGQFNLVKGNNRRRELPSKQYAPPHESVTTNNYQTSINYRKQPNHNILMSPIEQNSRHSMSSLINLDTLGDDIDCLLANSKNHEELCRLIGLELPQGQRSFPQGLPQRQFKNKSPMQCNGRQGQSNGREGESNKQSPGLNFRQTAIKINPPRNQATSDNQTHSVHISDSYFNRERQQPEVSRSQQFEYQNRPFLIGNKYDSQIEEYSQQDQRTYHRTQNRHPKQMARVSVQSNDDPPVFSYVGPNSDTPHKNNPSLATNSYISDLQRQIDKEMREMYENGKTRIFLSASDRFETVKYNMVHL